MKIFIVSYVVKEKKVSYAGLDPQSLKLDWADGMVGCLPVFDSEESAMAAYPDCGITIGEINNDSK